MAEIKKNINLDKRPIFFGNLLKIVMFFLVFLAWALNYPKIDLMGPDSESIGKAGKFKGKCAQALREIRSNVICYNSSFKTLTWHMMVTENHENESTSAAF